LCLRIMGNLWAAEWYQHNQLDGITRRIVYDDRCLPALFRTRRECRDYITEKYGYIKTRKDLRQEPHGWRLPYPVKVEISNVEGKVDGN
jgi:hypothetical protein